MDVEGLAADAYHHDVSLETIDDLATFAATLAKGLTRGSWPVLHVSHHCWRLHFRWKADVTVGRYTVVRLCAPSKVPFFSPLSLLKFDLELRSIAANIPGRQVGEQS